MRRLNDWLQTYMKYTQHSEAPESFHFWTGVGTIAGALRWKVKFIQPYYTWTPNFYIVFVAKPGIVTKSTSINNGKRLLREIPGIHFGPDAITWQALISTLAKSVEHLLHPDGHLEPMCCLTFTASEFGSLIDLQDRQMINILVDLWDGRDDAWQKVTKSQGIDIVENPWINIMAATTPSWLSDNLPRQMIGGGFTSRCLFIFGETKRHLVAYPSELINVQQFQQHKDDLIHDLEQIALLQGEVKLTPEAIKFGTIWYKNHYQKMLSCTTDAGGYMSRKQCHLHKLAIVLSAAKRDDLVITELELAAADKILEAIETDMGHVFQLIQTTTEMEKTTNLVEIVQKIGSIPKAELYRTHFMTSLSYTEFEQALKSAIQAGYVVEGIRGSMVVVERVHTASGSQASVG